MTNPLVTFIIPLYNAENYIKETIYSALNQSYPDIEIIVVDDFSTDNSYSIVSSIKSNKLTLVKNIRKGACAARNYGFELSKGEFIQYLDADDLLSSNKIEEQLKLILSNPSFISSSGWVKFKNDTNNLSTKKQFINKSYEKPIEWLLDSWQEKGMGQTSIWLTPRKLIYLAGNWDESLTINQDGDFFCRVLLNASQILYCENVIVYYRCSNPNSISQRELSLEKGLTMLKSYNLYEKYLEDYLSNMRVKKALATNYLRLIYLCNNYHPKVVELAWNYFNELKVGKPFGVGGQKFKLIVKFVGFKNALFLSRLFR